MATDNYGRIGTDQSYRPDRSRNIHEYPLTNKGDSNTAYGRSSASASQGRSNAQPYSRGKQESAREPYSHSQKSSSGQRGGSSGRAAEQKPVQRHKPAEHKTTAEDARAKGAAARRLVNHWTINTPLDPLLLILVLALLSIGVVMMFSASYTHSYYENDGNAYYYIRRQALFAVAGVVVMLIVSKFNYERLRGFLTYAAFGFSTFLLILTYIMNLNKESDFKRWLDLPGLPKFQPSEIAKFTLILLLAHLMAKYYGYIQSNKLGDGTVLKAIDDKFTSKLRFVYKRASTMSMALTLLYTFIISSVCILIIIENHLSCTILIFTMGVCMMWLGGVKKGYFLIVAVVVVGAIILVINKPDILPDYAEQRIVAWLDKDYDPLKSRWQTNQSLRAIASGGPFGLGLGNSRQKHMYVSEPHNDFIFAIVCEELGFVGGSAIICLFAALVWRAFHVAANVKSTFGALLIMGIALQIGIQVLVNIAVVTDTIPNTGISLPFFSYGGTSLLILLAEMGVALSVSRTSTIQKT